MTDQPESLENTSALKRALFALKDMRGKLDEVERARTEPIAIIGMGCRFPGGANSPELYWKILNDGLDVIIEVPAERWNIDEYYDPDQNAPGKMYVRKSGFIDNVDKFEPQFFGISPREAVSMDPQQRLLLEVTWEALEYAGIVPGHLAGSQTGVFIGMSTFDYSAMQMKNGDIANFDAYVGTGTSFSVGAGRISYVLGLHGPTLTLDTACSSALVAVHLACQSLRTGQASMALAGGVSLILAPDGTVSMSKSHALAPDGHSKTFDAAADGYARGEGCGVIVLKRLSDALADGDNILALIKGSAINHDGRSSGLTVPNGQAQQAVIRAALEDAGGVEPQQISFVETHGTGTQLGDPIEVRALAGALGTGRSKDQPLVLGSVKANIGHLEAAAGMAGLMKVVLAFHNERIPRQLHFKDPNPNIDWDALPVKVAGDKEIWRKGETSRLAGVNAFGFSGTNAHIVLEEPPLIQADAGEEKQPKHLLTLSANDENALTDLASRLSSYVESHPDTRLEDITYTANARRTHFPQRVSVIVDSAEQLREKLEAFKNKQEASGLLIGQVEQTTQPKIAFMFTGQGSQYPDMGRTLYETQPVYRTALERCVEILRPHLQQPLLSVIHPEPGTDPHIHETAYTQPALFAIEYALAELWRSWGITPSVVMGHSVGEYVAACVAGLFSLEDGLKLIAERGRLMQSLPQDGAMAAVFADKGRVAKAIAAYTQDVSIAAFNGPENIVISGRASTVQAILDDFARDGIKVSRLSVSHAFHSPLMDPILDSFEKTAASITYSKPGMALVSNVTGNLIPFKEMSQPAYWRTHIRQPVQFHKAMESLRDQGCTIFLELGPQPTLLGMGQRCISIGKNIWLPSLRQRKDDWQQMLESLGALHVHGIEVDWEGFHHGYSHNLIPLTTYPFQRQRYWFKQGNKGTHPGRQMLHPLLSRKIRSPKLIGAVYETELGINFPAFLNDHRIYETAIFPGTGYMEMAFAAALQSFPGQRYSLADMVIREALILPEEGEKTVQITHAPEEAGKAAFEIFSLQEGMPGAEETWKHHASGTLVIESPADASSSVDIEELKKSFTNQLDVSTFYQELADLGVGYGPSFQSLVQIWQGDSEALGEIRLSTEETAGSNKFQIHPALLDACFHLLGAAMPAGQHKTSEKTYVPVGMKKLELHQPGQSQVWAHVTFSSPITNEDGSMKEALTSNIKLLSREGALVAELTGLQMKQINRASILQAQPIKVEDWLYEINWQLSARPSSNNTIDHWLIFADSNGLGDTLAEQLKAGGMTVMLVKPGDEYQQLDRNNYRLSPRREEHFQQMLSVVNESLNGTRPGIIHLWSLDNPFDVSDQKTESALREAQRLACGSILHLVQALAEKSIPPAGLWLVTQDVHAVAPGKGSRTLAQASVWGLARTVATEYPNWNCVCVDITSEDKDQLFTEILAQDDENQISLRGGDRYVARLDRPQANTNKLVIPDHPFELAIPTPGMLDGLTLEPVRRRAPEPNEIEIRVKATGLNFRDVLNALGMYPGAKIPLGIECAGIVEAVGDGVTEFKIGDEVIGLTGAAFRSFATIPVERVFARPANVTLAQAVSIPTIFLTAAYGLHNLAGMKAGDRVLIHAAAGGVGLAAVQLAQRAGAEIFATAGSPEKHAYLESLGIKHIFDSRSLGFADEIMRVTNGKGVNIILNSLADEFIPKSLSVLTDHGCFLEMGKRDDWDQTKVSQLNPTLKYHRYDLGLEMVNDMPFVGGLLKDILSDFEKGVFKPIPVRTFSMESVREAFRFMAQAKHIGKIVITQEDTAPIRPDCTYLITGGLGGLGSVTLRWLIERSARHIVLMSRSEPTDEVCKTLNELRANGAEIVTIQGDVAHREDVERAIQTIESKMVPLRGIFHEAGVLDDGVLSQQNWSRFERVMNPKVYGAWHLHELTENIPLDFFILFSSAAAVLGPAGQGNYAAANAFLDGLAHFRRSNGLPALSINWGAWAEVGMAADLNSRTPQRSNTRETEVIKPEAGAKILDILFSEPPVQSIVLPINWNRLSQRQGNKTIQPLLRKIVRVQNQSGRAKPAIMILEQIKTLSAGERETAFQDYVKQQVINILGLDPAQSFNSLRALTDLGLDSLMAVELKNKIEDDLELNIPVTYFLEGATVIDLSSKLHRELGKGTSDEKDGNGETINSAQAKQLLENLDQLSEDEVNSLLNNLLTENKES